MTLVVFPDFKIFELGFCLERNKNGLLGFLQVSFRFCHFACVGNGS